MMRSVSRVPLFAGMLGALMFSCFVTPGHAADVHPDVAQLTKGFRQLELPAADYVICESECVGNAECKSFTYVKPGVQGQAPMCVLKKEALSTLAHDCCISAARPLVTHAQAESGLYQALTAWQNRVRARSSVSGQHDTLKAYAKKCDDATGITVPSFDCNAGRDVPGQGTIPAGTACNEPNVLNSQCDPGSKFQVLPGGNADAVAVAHCRKVGLPIVSDVFNDIAVIQYNKKNGALCFYQALSNLPHNPPAPLTQGESNWPNSNAHWISPESTEAIGCTGCHDNGGFIRSEYLAQLKKPGHTLPNEDIGFNNHTTPVKYVGLDYASNRSWTITASPAPGDQGLNCTTCHRLAVPNRQAFGRINGTGAHFANVATAASQASKNTHGPSSPIWMRPGQITYDAMAEKSATVYKNCAVGFFTSGFTTIPAGCTITPLGVSWTPPAPPKPPVNQACLNACKADRDACMKSVAEKGGPKPQQCVAELKACNAECAKKK